MARTQLHPGAVTGRPYGSFAGKAESVPEVNPAIRITGRRTSITLAGKRTTITLTGRRTGEV